MTIWQPGADEIKRGTLFTLPKSKAIFQCLQTGKKWRMIRHSTGTFTVKEDREWLEPLLALAQKFTLETVDFTMPNVNVADEAMIANPHLLKLGNKYQNPNRNPLVVIEVPKITWACLPQDLAHPDTKFDALTDEQREILMFVGKHLWPSK